MPKFRVEYKLCGAIEVEANTEEDVRDAIMGIIVEDHSNNIVDEVLLDGIIRTNTLGHPHFNIDGDAIEICEVEELKEDA